MVLDVVQLLLGEVIEDKVVLQAAEDEGLVRLRLDPAQGLDAFVADSETDLVESEYFLLLANFLHHY
jgi:hypothetical protein